MLCCKRTSWLFLSASSWLIQLSRFVSIENIGETVKQLLSEVNKGMFDKAIQNRNEKTYDCTSMDEIVDTIKEKGDGFVRAMWCGDEACEDKVKEVTGVGSRCIPFDRKEISDKCVCCQKPAKHMLLWGKAY